MGGQGRQVVGICIQLKSEIQVIQLFGYGIRQRLGFALEGVDLYGRPAIALRSQLHSTTDCGVRIASELALCRWGLHNYK